MIISLETGYRRVRSGWRVSFDGEDYAVFRRRGRQVTDYVGRLSRVQARLIYLKKVNAGLGMG